MKIVDSVKKFFNFEKRQTSQVIELNKDDEKLLEWLGISPSDISVKGKNALKVATVFACIKILSESVSKLPLKIYQEDEYGIQRGTKHYLNNLLRLRPNPYMSSMNFFGALEAQKNLYGNSYSNIEFDRKGKVQALWPI
ncbi:phage portal protein, partial [Salmonella enterica subsp. enterica serovar Javiana]|nr:phage portal protein [Salmonella enterica subsp. enterica serovar Javiana]